MKKVITLMLAASGLMSFAGSALSNSACDKPRNNFDDMYCLSKVYQEADVELNKNYKKLMGKLDANGKTALKAGQIDWIKTRNNNCSRHEDDNFLVDLNCATQITIQRAQFLQDRYRECISAGCQNSKLAQ